MKEELISVVTLTHNKAACTRRCLASLLKTDYSSWELIVVDNGSTDGTREWLELFRDRAADEGVKVELVLNNRNAGCSTARNQGLGRALGGKTVFVDNDVALRTACWLRRLSACLDAAPERVMAGPKLVYPFGEFRIQCAGAAVSRSGRVQFRGRGRKRIAPLFNEEREVQSLISACIMVKTGIVARSGGFDEAFNPVEYEDIDLCYRLRSRGYKIMYLPSVEMYHFEGVTTTGTPALPNTYLIVKHGLLFKKRWKYMFEKEDGPSDDQTRWRRMPVRNLESVGELPVVRE
jgi:GT2 family glycosyltransferase